MVKIFDLPRIRDIRGEGLTMASIESNKIVVKGGEDGKRQRSVIPR